MWPDAMNWAGPKPRRCIFREGFYNLLSCPDSSRARRHVEVNDLTPVMQQDDETVYVAECDCRNCEEINGLSRDGLAHRCEYLLIRWESHPPLFRYHLIAYPDAELAAVAFDQFRLYS